MWRATSRGSNAFPGNPGATTFAVVDTKVELRPCLGDNSQQYDRVARHSHSQPHTQQFAAW